MFRLGSKRTKVRPSGRLIRTSTISPLGRSLPFACSSAWSLACSSPFVSAGSGCDCLTSPDSGSSAIAIGVAKPALKRSAPTRVYMVLLFRCMVKVLQIQMDLMHTLQTVRV